MKFILLTLLLSCTTISSIARGDHFYAIGDCGVLVDYETGKSNPNDIFRVEAYENGRYIYRWWYPNFGWSVNTSSQPIAAIFENLEKISRRCKCPKD